MDVRSISRRASIIGVALAVCVNPTGATQQPAAAQQPSAQQPSSQQLSIQQRLQALQREARELQTKERTLLNELRRLQVDREIKAAELESRTVALDEAAAAVAALEKQQAALAGQIAREQPLVRARLVELYKRGRAGNLRRLVDAASARDAMRAWRQMAAAASRDADRFAEHRAALSALATSRADLDARRAEADKLQRQAASARAALDRSIARYRDRIDNIGDEQDLNAALIAELKAAQAGLAATVEKLPNTATPRGAAPITAFRRALPWPAAGRVVRSFRSGGRSTLPFNGIEIELQDGAPIAAVYPGDVAFSGPFTGFGHLIIVQHGPETFTLYGHLRAGHVAKGDRVTTGQIIGRAGQPPGSRDSRLYFELRIDGQPVDPLQWLRQQ